MVDAHCHLSDPLFAEKTEEKIEQMKIFRINMDMAKETKLPLVVHNRNADAEIKQLLEDFEGSVQLHCFVGEISMLNWAVSKNYYVSVGGILTFKKSNYLRELARLIPDHLLLIETDAPYLSPEPLRGTRNEPANVKIIFDEVAKLRNVPMEQLAELVITNSINLFKIKL